MSTINSITLQTSTSGATQSPITIGNVDGTSTIQNFLSSFYWNVDKTIEEEYIEKLFVALVSLLNGMPESVVKQKLANDYQKEYKNLCIHVKTNSVAQVPKDYIELTTIHSILPFNHIDIRFDFSKKGIKNNLYYGELQPVDPKDGTEEEQLWLFVESNSRTLVINSYSPKSPYLKGDIDSFIGRFILEMSHLLSNRAQYGL